ncbi:MAG: hypothetical protein RL701_2736 [Pseudomonadota bacterium]|jgi:hypothetical protein
MTPGVADRAAEPIVRHFRQIMMWPLQLMPLGPRSQAPSEHWQAFIKSDTAGLWHEVEDEFGDPDDFQERHYREFVTFLPHAQRFLYGQGRSSASLRGYGESPMRVFRRTDIAQIRLTFSDETQLLMTVQHVDLYFYHDVDVVMLAFEYFADDIPLSRVQELVYRFGRAYPAQWDAQGVPDQCMRNVEWLNERGEVLAASDFMNRKAFLSHVCEHRESRIGRHWDYLLRPMVQHHSELSGEIRYRQLEHHHLPKMTYLSFDNPFVLAREDFYRLGMATEPGIVGEFLPYHDRSVARFESEHCYDHFWMPERGDMRASTRIVCTPRAMLMVGCASSRAFSDCDTGMLGQFRHHYFLLGMTVHFHHAAFLMFSDRMVLSVSRLNVDDPDSLERFREHMRDTTETFLRFNHRYWFHEVSKDAVVRDLFKLWSQQLSNDELFQEIREEILDMGEYLDGDASRRQSDIVLRLTVVTILGSIGTIATGFLGMNLIDESAQPLHMKILYFLAVMVPSVLLTFFIVMKSGPLAKWFDQMASERMSARSKIKRLLRGPQMPRFRPVPKRARLTLSPPSTRERRSGV